MRVTQSGALPALSCVLALALSVFAEAKEQRWTYFGVRPLAMGNAFVAVADDQNALFYNPAGLARLKDWDFEIINPTIEVAQRTIPLGQELVNKAKNKSDDVDSLLSTFEAQTGKTHSFALKLNPHFITTNWGFALGLDNYVSLVFHEDIEVEVNGGSTAQLPIAVAFNFLENRLALGASIKYINFMGVDQTFSIDSLAVFTNKSGDKKVNDYLQAGHGIGVDVGLLFTPIDTMEPTLGISVTDVGGTSFSKMSAKYSAPTPREPALNTGVSIKPLKTEHTYLLLALDSQFINRPVHFSHKLNFGMEWGYSRLLKVETGLHDGDISAGLQFDVGLLNLRLATYVVDHGPVVGLDPDLSERRYALQFKLII